MTVMEHLQTLTRDSLDARAAVLAELTPPRVRLHDGSLGHRLAIETAITLKLGADPFDPKAPEEEIMLLCPESEVRFNDPVLTMDGAVRFDLEIVSYVGEGVSETLWPGEKVRILVGRGVDPMLRATFGRFEITPDTDFGKTPVESVQQVFLALDTPIGRLQNREPARMVASITSVPPVGGAYVQDGIVRLHDEAGQIRASKTATASTIVELLAGVDA